eukprot:319766-Rhodomonas_salina.1
MDPVLCSRVACPGTSTEECGATRLFAKSSDCWFAGQSVAFRSGRILHHRLAHSRCDVRE